VLTPRTTFFFLTRKSCTSPFSKNKVLLLERVLLHTISFDLSVVHPYKFVIELSKQLNSNVGSARGFRKVVLDTAGGVTYKALSTVELRKEFKDLTQYAVNLVNDSLQTYICLQFHPKDVALACIFFAAFRLNLEPTSTSSSSSSSTSTQPASTSADATDAVDQSDNFTETWCERLEIVDMEALNSIIQQIEEIYQTKKKENAYSKERLGVIIDQIDRRQNGVGQQQQSHHQQEQQFGANFKRQKLY